MPRKSRGNNENPRPRRRRRRRRSILIVVAVLVLALGSVIVLAPTIASAVAPGPLGRAASGAIPGSLAFDDLSLSWLGPQRVGSARLEGADGERIATLSATTDASLLSLLRGSRDLGTIAVDGEATIVRGADGRTNLERALGLDDRAQSPGGPDEPDKPIQLPESLAARVRFDDVEVNWRDEMSSADAEGVLSGTASFATGAGAEFDLAATMRSVAEAVPGGSGTVGVPDRPGSLTLVGTATNLTTDGRLDPAGATVDATLAATDAPVGLIDALAGLDGRLEDALGAWVTTTVAVQGDATEARADLQFAAATGRANLEVGYDGETVALRSPATIEADGPALLEAWPDLRQVIGAGGRLELLEAPTLTIEIASAAMPLDLEGAGFNLGAASLEATLRATAAAARLAQAEDARPLEVRTQPIELRISAAPLSAGIHAEGTAGATIDGQSAGALRISLDAEPFDGSGALRSFERPGDLNARGELALTGFETRIAQPYVEELGLQLTEDLGPVADLRVEASPADAGATTLAMSLRSRNVSADARAILDGAVVTLAGNGLSAEIASPGPTLTRLLQDAGVAIESAERITLHVAEGRADLESLARGDLRGAGARIQLNIGPAQGTLLAGDQRRAFQTRPISASINADDFGGEVALQLAAGAEVDGQEAGSLDLTASASDLLGPDGALKLELPRTLVAEGAVTDMSTALAQPWLAETGLQLPQDLGPALAIEFDARPQGEAVALRLVADAQKASARSRALWDGQSIRTTGPGATILLRNPGPTLARLAPPDARFVPGAGIVRIEVADAVATLSEGFALETITGLATVTAENFRATPAGGGPGVVAERIALRFDASAEQTARLQFEGALRHGDAPFTMNGAFDLASPLTLPPTTSWAAMAIALRPAGSLTITDLPPAVAAMFAPAPTAPGAPDAAPDPRAAAETPLDIGRLINLITEAPMTLRLETAPAQDAIAITFAADGGATQIALEGQLAPQLLQIASASAEARIEPGLLTELAPESGARLLGAAPVQLVVSSLEIPLTETGALDRSAIGDIALQVSAPGRLLVGGLTVAGAEGEPARELPPIGVRGMTLEVAAPGAALTSAGEVSLRGEMEVITEGDHAVAQATFGGAAQTSEGRLSGDPAFKLTLRNVDAGFLDLLAGRDQLVSGATGGPISEIIVEAAARLETESGRPTLQSATLAVQAPRLRIDQPIRLQRDGGVLALEAPVEIQWRAVPGWTNIFVARAEGAPVAQPTHARFSAPAEIIVRLQRFAIGPPGAYLAPGSFALAATATSERIGLMTGAGDDVSFTNLAIELTGGEAPGEVRFALQAGQSGVEEGGPLRATGALTSLANQRGEITTDQAALTLDVEAPALRSAAVDSIIRQGGLVHALMGETMSIEAHIENLSGESGTVSASATSPRATMAIEARVQEGVLAVSGPERLVTLREITPELNALLAPSLPQIARFQKRPEDEPALITQQDLFVPFDGDLTKLRGVVTINLGDAQFQPSSAFTRLLKVVQQDGQAMIGRRLEPLTLRMDAGVVTYDRFTIPLGEFNLQTSGTVDLPQKRLDVVTWIPIGALTDEAAGMFNTGLGSLLGRAVPELERLTLVPWRTSGTFGDTRTLPAPRLFAENVGGRLLRPDRMLRDVFRDYLPGGDRGGEEPEPEPEQPTPAPQGGEPDGGGG